MDRQVTSPMALQAPLGINYVCSSCGTLLYHTGRDGAFEGGEVGFRSRQPYEVAENLVSCPKCGHKLNSSPDPESFKILAKTDAT